MEEKDIFEILKIILKSIGKKKFNWNLEGSANLFIQGIRTNIQDLDITADEEGLEVFREKLKKYVVKDFYNEKIKAKSIKCNISNFEIEINCFADARAMPDKARIIEWKGFEIPIMPLENELEFYKLIDRKDKIKLIEDYLIQKDKKIIRAFIAIDFPGEIVKEVARVQEVLEKIKFTGKMTETENLHLTLKFLGEIDSDRLKEIKRKLREIKFFSFEAHLDEVGLFRFRGNPRIVWIKIGGKGIFELQKKIEQSLRDLFSEEERFMSHLTVARIKYVKDKKGFEERISAIKTSEIKFKVKNFKLKSSELRRIGPVYKDIEIYPSKQLD